MIKQIMIPVAAFAVSVTTASAFNGDMLLKIDVDLSDEQVAALEEAHELRQSGADKEKVVEVLEDAGLDQGKMKEMRRTAIEYRNAHREAVKEAIEDNDYQAYLEAVADTPRVEIINSEADFDKLVEAHKLRGLDKHQAVGASMTGFDFAKGLSHGRDMFGRDGEKNREDDVRGKGHNGHRFGQNNG